MITTATCPAKLVPLVERLEALTRRATIDELDRWLRGLNICLQDVAPFARFGEHTYHRNLVCSGPWFHLLVLCWRSGQRSPIHNHAGSTCGLRVLTGVGTETRFAFTASGLIRPTISQDIHDGDIVASQDADIHQISNLQAPGHDLVTLHIYSPPVLRMDSYSLTDGAIREYRPVNYDFSQGGGI